MMKDNADDLWHMAEEWWLNGDRMDYIEVEIK